VIVREISVENKQLKIRTKSEIRRFGAEKQQFWSPAEAVLSVNVLSSAVHPIALAYGRTGVRGVFDS
jgi:hypothetical protein